MILDSNTHQRLNIRIVKLFDLLLLTAVFALTWGLYYADKMTYPFYNLGNYMMIGLFFIIDYLITRLYRGYAIHLFRISAEQRSRSIPLPQKLYGCIHAVYACLIF